MMEGLKEFFHSMPEFVEPEISRIKKFFSADGRSFDTSDAEYAGELRAVMRIAAARMKTTLNLWFAPGMVEL
jgi:hypothetical protein